MNDEQTARLCELVTRAHLAGVHTSRTLWSRVANALDAVCDRQPPRQLVSELLAASLYHPLASAVPRDPVHAREVLRWLREQWSARGWNIPPEFTSDGPPCPGDPPELFYKTYVGWGGAEGVTLLESVGGIVHNTTGLTTWCGAAVLAAWAVDNSAILARRRVLELGAGVGFTASVILTSQDASHPPPTSYVVTDCHHHVLTLLHHNLALNLASSPPEREKLEKFQMETSMQVGQEEVEAGEVVTWRPPLPPASPPAAAVAPGAGLGTEVSVMQVDWRRPPRLPPADLLLAADVVYARHLIPPLVALVRSVLDGSASRQPSDDQVQNETESEHSENELTTTPEDKVYRNSRKREAVVGKDEAWGHPGEFTSRADEAEGDESGGLEREAFIACTRRNQETVAVFLEEVSRQGLHHSLVYQASLDTHTALFLYNETHLPVKIFRITLPQEPLHRTG